MNIERAVGDLSRFSGGVVDTSTLIYLERLSLLSEVASACTLLVIPQVEKEFGGNLPRALHFIQAPEGDADNVVCATALKKNTFVLSEDGKVLRQAAKNGLPYFNTLMLLLFLYTKGKISSVRYLECERELRTFARYSEVIYDFGRKVMEYAAEGNLRLTNGAIK